MHINTGTIYRKTGKLLWTRLLTGLLLVGSAGILLGAFMLVGVLANRFDIKFLLFLAWIPAAVLDITILRHFFSYRISAGYAAVVQNVLATGRAPDNAVDTSARVVNARFENPAAYAEYDKSVKNSLREILKSISFRRKRRDGRPISQYAEVFDRLCVMWLHVQIRYCVLAYTFYRYDQDVFTSAADGVAIYYCNYRKLQQPARTFVFINIAVLAAGTALFSVPICALFGVFDWSMVLAVLCASGVAWAIKFAFIDSYLYIGLMRSFRAAVDATPIPAGLYAWLSERSHAYAVLYRRGRKKAAESNYMDVLYGSEEMPAVHLPGFDDEVPPQGVGASGASRYASSSTTAQLKRVESRGKNPYAQYELSLPQTGKPVYCMKCGSKNYPGARVCTNCGRELNS